MTCKTNLEWNELRGKYNFDDTSQIIDLIGK